jgi:chemotaxis protein CheX
MIDELELSLKSAVTDVVKTMLSQDVRSIPLDKRFLSDGQHLASCVGFIGEMTGVIYLYAASSHASRMTAALLGISEVEIEGDNMVNDSMGELTSMVVGKFKAALGEHGHACVLTIPSIVRGNSFSIGAVSSITRRVLCFRCGETDNLILELLIKPSEH